MSLSKLSIKRPTFLTCVILLMLTVGWISMRKLPVDLFPDINFPIVTVTTIYPGAGPNEIESNVSKVIEDEVSGISGIKTLRSISREGVSSVVVEFNLEVDVKMIMVICQTPSVCLHVLRCACYGQAATSSSMPSPI